MEVRVSIKELTPHLDEETVAEAQHKDRCDDELQTTCRTQAQECQIVSKPEAAVDDLQANRRSLISKSTRRCSMQTLKSTRRCSTQRLRM